MSGVLDINRVVERLKDLLKGLKKGDSIVIQLHGVKNKELLDELLLQLIFFGVIYHEGFHYLPDDLFLYVEIQNITGEQQMVNYHTLRLFDERSEAVIKIGRPLAKDVEF